LEGEAERLYVTVRVATDLRADGSSEENCEPSVDKCDGFHKLIYRL
jgi:hypothetical protein